MSEHVTDGQAGVTEADRETAMRALNVHATWALDELSDETQADVDRIAAALAAEREKARAPFLALADEYDANINWREWGVGNRIRRTAEDAP